MAKFMKETGKFHFGMHMKPELCAKDDTGHMVFKNDLMEFRISMSSDSTSVVMQLTCHSAQSNHSLMHAGFMILHVV